MSKPTKRKAAERGGTSEPFEMELARLEEIVARFEKGDLGLEEALAAFEKGIGLTRSLMQRLDAAEKRIEILLEKSGGDSEFREISEDNLDEGARGADSDEEEDDEE